MVVAAAAVEAVSVTTATRLDTLLGNVPTGEVVVAVAGVVVVVVARSATTVENEAILLVNVRIKVKEAKEEVEVVTAGVVTSNS